MLAVAVLAMGIGAGCQTHVNAPTKADLNLTPLVVDESMQKRDWNRSVAEYGNGATVAGPDLIVIESAGPEALQRMTDPAISSANDTITPITTVFFPPWKDVIYQGVVVPPTYTAQPASRVMR